MKRILLALLLLCSGFCQAQILNPARWSYEVREVSAQEVDLLFHVNLNNGWHLYSQHTDEGGPLPLSFVFSPSNQYSRQGGVVEPKAHEAFDSLFGCRVRWFDGAVTFRQRILRKTEKPFSVSGTLSHQLCNNGSCIPPDDIEFLFDVKAASLEAAPSPSEGDASADSADAAETSDSADASIPAQILPAEAPANPIPSNDDQPSILSLFLIAFAGGLLSIITPCVFPMIPLTVNFFLRGSENRRRNRRQALFFGLSIIFIFTILGALLTLIFGSSALYFLGTHWIPNLCFFVIFIIFALSFFGLFEIKMPERWSNASDSKADTAGLLAPFFVALTTVLVSFSCTGPIIGTALISLATATTNRWVSLVSLAGFGIGFALPFSLLAFFPSFLKKLKSGSWLNTVKVVFAFLELAFALKFLSMADLYCGWRLLDREVFLALWIVIFGLLGVYLLGKLRFKGDDPVEHIGVSRLLLAIASLAFVVYMIPGLWGAPLKGISGFIPPLETQDFLLSPAPAEAHSQEASAARFSDQLSLPPAFCGYFDLEEARSASRIEHKPIFLDFTGKTCANCREMEHYVWSDPSVQKTLQNDFIICALFVDANEIPLPEDEWVTDSETGKTLRSLGSRNLHFQKTQFHTNAQPFYAIVDADGHSLTSKNHKYNRNVDDFLAFLNEGLSNFNKK